MALLQNKQTTFVLTPFGSCQSMGFRQKCHEPVHLVAFDSFARVRRQMTLSYSVAVCHAHVAFKIQVN
jgi:hypothetical protein